MIAAAPAIPYGGGALAGQGPINGRTGIRYPSPFFDLSQAYLPQNPRALFAWCRYYAMTYGPVYVFVTKMSAYSLTRIQWGGDTDKTLQEDTRTALEKQWEELFEKKLHVYERCMRLGLHYWTYGNGYASVIFPFTRYLICPSCKHQKAFKDFKPKEYRWRNYHFHGPCPSCRHTVEFIVYDKTMRTTNGMRIKIWNPEQVRPVTNESNDYTWYYYEPSERLAVQIRNGDRHVLETTPWPFIKAVQDKGFVALNPNNFFHIRAPSPDSRDNGMGHPPILAAIRDIFHLQLLKRAEEANAVERTIPLAVVHPVPFRNQSPTDPHSMVNLQKLGNYVTEQLDQARQDPNYIPWFPVPVGVTHIWGDGKNLLLVPEIRSWTELIAADLGMPPEFFLGSLNWTGSNVSLRMLENQILSFREGYAHFTEFVANQCAQFLRYPKVEHSWKPFKMADDVQMKALYLQLSQLKKVGDTSLLAQFDLDPSKEFEDIKKTAERDLEVQEISAVGAALLQGKIMKAQRDQALAMGLPDPMMAQMMPPAGAAPAPPGAVQAPGGEQAAAGPAEAAAPPPPGADVAAQGGMPGMPVDPGVPAAPMGPEQMAPPPTQGEEPMQATVIQIADVLAQRLANVPPNVAQAALSQIAQRSPALFQAVLMRIRENQSMQSAPLASQQDLMRPLPEQRPPRRGPATALI